MMGAVPGSAPVPPHWEHATVSSTGTFASAPRSESSNERRTSVSTSPPRTGCRPAHRLGACTPAAAARGAAEVPEQPAEDVAEIAEVDVAEVDVDAAGAGL